MLGDCLLEVNDLAKQGRVNEYPGANMEIVVRVPRYGLVRSAHEEELISVCVAVSCLSAVCCDTAPIM